MYPNSPVEIRVSILKISQQGYPSMISFQANVEGTLITVSTYPHSKLCSSDLSIFLNLESRNALISAYSASPSRRGKASKQPMQPRSRGARPGRDERVFHVTNSGLRYRSSQQGAYNSP